MTGEHKQPTYTRAQIKEAFGLVSEEMTRGELLNYSAQLEARNRGSMGETTRGNREKQNSGSVPGLVGPY